MGFETLQQGYSEPTSIYSYQSVHQSKFPDFGAFLAPIYPPSYGLHHPYGYSSDNNHYGSGANHYAGSKVHASVQPNIDGYGSSCYEDTYAYENPQHHGHVTPHNLGHGSPHYENSYAHENSYGHENPHHYGHGSPYKHTHGSPTGFRWAPTNQINKLTPGHNNYEYSYTHENSHKYYGNGSQFEGHGIRHNQGITPGLGGAIKNQYHKLTYGHNKYGSGSPSCRPYPGGINNGYQQHSWERKAIDDDDLTSENN